MIMRKSLNRNLSPTPQEGGTLRTTRQETIIPRSPGSGGKEGVKQKKEGVIM
jgi:hypothetical protein